VSGRRDGTKLRRDFYAIVERHGKYKARAAVARKLLTLVFYGALQQFSCSILVFQGQEHPRIRGQFIGRTTYANVNSPDIVLP
jgi:hypothetical protein